MLFTCQWKEVANREAIMQGKHAKVLSPTQERAIVRYLDTTPSPARVVYLSPADKYHRLTRRLS